MKTTPVATPATVKKETFEMNTENTVMKTFVLKNPEDEGRGQEGGSSPGEADRRFTTYQWKKIDEITGVNYCPGTSKTSDVGGDTTWQPTSANLLQSPACPAASEDGILMAGTNVSGKSQAYGSDKIKLTGKNNLNIRPMTSVRALAMGKMAELGTRESVEQMFQRLSSPENINVWQMTTRSGGRIGKASVQDNLIVKLTHSQKSVKKSRGPKFFVAKRDLLVNDSKARLSADLEQNNSDSVMDSEHINKLPSISSPQQVSYHPREGIYSNRRGPFVRKTYPTEIASETSTRGSAVDMAGIVDTERKVLLHHDVSPIQEPSNISIILYTPHGCLKTKKYKIKFRSPESLKSNANSSPVAEASQTSGATCFTQEISEKTKHEWRSAVMSRDPSLGGGVAEETRRRGPKPRSRKRFLKNTTKSHLHKNEDRSSPLHQNTTSPFDSYDETSASIDEAVIFSEKEVQKEDISRNFDCSKSQTRLDIQDESRSEYQKHDTSSHYKHAASVLDESVSSSNSHVEVMDHCADNMYDYRLLYCKSCMKYFVKQLDFKKHMKFCSVHRTCGKCFMVFKTRLRLFNHIAQKKHNVKLLNLWVDLSFPKLQKLKAEGKLWFDSLKDLDKIRVKRIRLPRQRQINKERKAVFSGFVCDNSQISNIESKISYPDLTGNSVGEYYNPSASVNTETSPKELLNSLGASNSEQPRVLDKFSASSLEILKEKQKNKTALYDAETNASKADSPEVSSGSEISFGEAEKPRELSNSETRVKNLMKLPVSSSEPYEKFYKPSLSDSETSSSKLDKEQGLLESETRAGKPNTTKGSSSSRDLPEEPDVVQTNSDEKGCLIMRRLLNENTSSATISNDINENTNDVAEEIKTGRRKTSGDKKHYEQYLILCNQCKTYFIHRESYSQHRLHCKPKKNACIRCGHIFKNLYQLQQHIITARHAISSQAVVCVSRKKLEYLITKGRVSENDVEKDKFFASLKKEKGYFKPEKESLISKPFVTKTEIKMSDPCDQISLSEHVDLSDMIVVDQYINPSLLRSQRTTEDSLEFPSSKNHEDNILQSAVEDCQDAKSDSEDGTYIKVGSMKLKSGYEDARALNSGCINKETVKIHVSYSCILKENLVTNSGTVQEKGTTSNSIHEKEASSKFVSEKDIDEFVKKNNATCKSIQVEDATSLQGDDKIRLIQEKDVTGTLPKVKDASSISIQEKGVISKLLEEKDTTSKSLCEKTASCKVALAQEKDPTSKRVQVEDASSKLLQEKNCFNISLQEKDPANILVQVKQDAINRLVQEKDVSNKSSPEKVTSDKSVLENYDVTRSIQGKAITSKSGKEKGFIVKPGREKGDNHKLEQKRVDMSKSGPETDSLVKPEREKAVTVKSTQKKFITSKTQEEGECTSKSGQEKDDTIIAVQETDSTSKFGKEKNSTVKSVQEKDITSKLIKKRDSLMTISSLKRKGTEKESHESSVSVLSQNECVVEVQHSMAHEKKEKLRTILENNLMKEVKKKGKKNHKTLDDIQNSVSCLGEPMSQFSDDSRCLVDDICLDIDSENIIGGHDEESIIFKDVNDIPVKAVKETEAQGIVDKVTLLTETVVEERGHKTTAVKREASYERPMPKSRKIARSLALSKLSNQKEHRQPSPIKRRSVRLEKLTEECPGCLQTIDVETVIFNTLTHELSFWCKKCAWDIIFLNFGQPNDS